MNEVDIKIVCGAAEVEYCTVAGIPIANPVNGEEVERTTKLNCCDAAFVLVIIPSISMSLLSASSNKMFRA